MGKPLLRVLSSELTVCVSEGEVAVTACRLLRRHWTCVHHICTLLLCLCTLHSFFPFLCLCTAACDSSVHISNATQCRQRSEISFAGLCCEAWFTFQPLCSSTPSSLVVLFIRKRLLMTGFQTSSVIFCPGSLLRFYSAARPSAPHPSHVPLHHWQTAKVARELAIIWWMRRRWARAITMYINVCEDWKCERLLWLRRSRLFRRYCRGWHHTEHHTDSHETAGHNCK